MVKIYVIDNGGQWTHREWRVLKYLGVDTKMVPNTLPQNELRDVDALVFSGGSPRISFEDYKLGNLEDYMNLGVPILGICVGMQFIAKFFGGECGSADIPEYGKTEIKILNFDDLFDGLPKRFTAWESHNDEVKQTNLEILASSQNCKIQAIKHNSLPIYGVQFHPEVEHTEYGVKIFENFIRAVKR
ncbi:MAG: GMP synthase subunit A [Nanoarchaeota archaeon]|nr:GMP synthase subunit A [Nanoarchaeota archaeon]